MKRRLLILSTPFDKPSYAPRLRFLCDYLTKQGWLLDVYVEKSEILDFPHDYPIHEITLTHGTMDWMLKTLWTLLTDWKSRAFTRQVLKQIGDTRYDAVFCTTFSSFPLQSALAIAEHLQIPLHADIRDLDEQIDGAQYQSHRAWWTVFFRDWYKQVNIRRRNRVLRASASISTISPWHVEFIRKMNQHVHLVYNGFDAQLFSPKDIPTPTFRITYMGRLYSESFQDPTPLLQAVEELGISDIEVHFYTNPDGQERVRDKAFVHDYVPPTEVPLLLQESSILVVLTNTGAHGMMTTKYYEALGVEKPILCIPNDGGCLAQVIQDTQSGLASGDVEEIKSFILGKYMEWKEKGFTRQKVQGKEQFSRQYQAQLMEEILATL